MSQRSSDSTAFVLFLSEFFEKILSAVWIQSGFSVRCLPARVNEDKTELSGYRRPCPTTTAIYHLRSKSRLCIILTLIGNLSKNYGAIFLLCIRLELSLGPWLEKVIFTFRCSMVHFPSLLWIYFKIDIQTIGHKTSVVKSYRLLRSLDQGLSFRRAFQ